MRRTKLCRSLLLLAPLVCAGLAGCADPAPPAGHAAAGSPSPPRPSPPGMNPFNPAPSSPPAAPPSCEPNQGWTAQQQTSWLGEAAGSGLMPGSLREDGVTIATRRHLCRPIEVHVEYFTLTWSGNKVRAESVSLATIRSDGAAASLPLPAPIAGRDACTGAAVAVYTGPAPLAEAELPHQFGGVLEQWADRVAGHGFRAPRNAAVDCPGH